MPRTKPDHLKRTERILVWENTQRFQVLQEAADAEGQDFPDWVRETLYRGARDSLARQRRRPDPAPVPEMVLNPQAADDAPSVPQMEPAPA